MHNSPTNNSLKIDEFESRGIEAVLKAALIKNGVDVIRTQLNRSGYADYLWLSHDHCLEHLERKQVSEILSDIDGVAEQLRKEQTQCENLRLVVEGVAEPESNGTAIYQVRPNGQGFRKIRRSGIPYNRYEGFLVGLQHEGIPVYKTSSWMGTAELVLRLYKFAQREEHTTLSRHTAPHIERFTPNPQVRALMGLCAGLDDGASNNDKIRMGAATAESLIEAFQDIWTVLTIDPQFAADIIPGLGKQRLDRLAVKVGKNK